MSVTELSEKVGITMANISILKMEKQKPSVFPLSKNLPSFGVSTGWFVDL